MSDLSTAEIPAANPDPGHTPATLNRRSFFSRLGSAAMSADTRWYPLQGLNDVVDGVLWGVWAESPDYLIAVGDNGVILVCDRDHWQRQASGTHLPLHAVWGLDRQQVWAVGWMGAICHYQQGEWRLLQGGKIDPQGKQFLNCRENQPLFGLWGDAPDNLWAVGDHGRITHFDGTAWQELDSGVDTHLRGVLGTADGTLLACGMQGLILRYDGTGWQRMETGSMSNFVRFWARNPNEIYAIGSQYNINANRFVGQIFRLQGNNWQEIPSHQALQRLRGISGDADSITLVGDQGSLYRLNEAYFETLDSGVSHDLLDVVQVGSDDTVIVGDFGTVLRSGHHAGQSTVAPDSLPAQPSGHWQTMPQSVTNRVLWSVWGATTNNVFAVGESGTIIHYDGVSWTSMPSPTTVHLHGIWGSSPKNVYAVGQIGTVLHYNGEQWQQVYRLPVDVTAVAITGFGPHDIFVVGDEGLILRYDGAQWERLSSGTKNALYGVWGMDPEHVLAVGDFGTVLRWNGKDWKAFNAGTENFLYSVWGDALDNIFIAGLSGTLAHFDGTSWSLQPTRLRADLLGVTGLPGQRPVAVGTLGTALSDTENGWVSEETNCDTGLRALWMAADGTAFAVGDKGTVLQRKPIVR